MRDTGIASPARSGEGGDRHSVLGGRAPLARTQALLGALALAILGLALAAGPASAAPPTATVTEVDEVSYDHAHAHGIVDPGNQTVMYYFQYSTEPETGLWFYGPHYFERFIPAGSGPTEVDEEFHGEQEYVDLPFFIELEGNTTYYVRVVAAPIEGGEPSVYSGAPYTTFKTKPVEKPTVPTVEVGDIANRTALLSGSVGRPSNPDPAFNAHCHFEYLTDAAYQARSEKQRLTIKASGGTYTLNYSLRIGQFGETTGPIPYNAPKAVVQAEIESLALIGPGGVSVTGGPGSATGAFPYTINFTGPRANKNLLGVNPNGANLTTSGETGPEAFTTTVIDGHAEGFENAPQLPCSTDPVTAPGATTPVEAELTGLSPNTSYHVQLTAKNAGGPTSKVASVFTTNASPVVQTVQAGTVHETSAVLGGKVNPQNAAITYQFEWGTSTGYGNLLPASPIELEAIDESSHVVTLPLTGLSPATTYHYRLVATNTVTNQVIQGEDQVFTTAPLPKEAKACPNESSRTGPELGIPDCRAYEFVTPELNQTALTSGMQVLPDGSGIEWGSLDAPENADDNEAFYNVGVSMRGPDGWTTKSLGPPLPKQAPSYFNVGVMTLLSEDFGKWTVASKEPLAGSGSPSPGVQYYLREPDGSYVPMTTGPSNYAGGGGCCIASRDFSHIFFAPDSKQTLLEQPFEDPINEGNAYEWANGERKLVGVFVNGGTEEPAPQGARIPLPQSLQGTSVSGDGARVLFKANNYPGLYLRTEDKETDEVAETERSPADPNPLTTVRSVGISDDGSTVLFESPSELTNDAYTGRTGGVSTDAGSDLYSYDTQTKKLTDLTVDTKPADKATGANVQFVVGTNPDLSYVYFLARGSLAPGGISGAENLYVWHDGEIKYVAENPAGAQESRYPFYVTPDGTHAAFMTSAVMTAYDNTDPGTGEAMQEVYEYTYGGALVCGSCRPDGEAPSRGSGIVGRALSNDGSRLFFESEDAIIPEASNGLANVFEFEEGEIHMISPPGAGSTAHLYGASASGNDVFIETFGEIAPAGQGNVMAIYDARVDAVDPEPPAPACQGESCRGAPTVAPQVASPGSATFTASVRISVSEAKVLKGKRARLRVIVPDAGQLKISGKGLKPVEEDIAGRGSVTVTLDLNHAGQRKRQRKGRFETRAQVIFTSSAGDTSREEAPLKFDDDKKGGR